MPSERKTGRITLKMIAEQAKVSPTLVSNILNGKGRASREVHDRIFTMLEKNGFVPRNRQRPVILIGRPVSKSDSLAAQMFLSMLDGIASVFTSSRIMLQLELPANTSGNTLLHIMERNPAGIIVQTGTELHPDIVKLSRKNGIPVVQAGYDDELADANAVVVDSYNGSYSAVSRMIACGSRRPGIIRWETGGNSQKKFNGYKNALNDAGIPFDPSLVIRAPSSRRELSRGEMIGRCALEKLLEQCGDRPPDSVFVENGFISPSLLYPIVGDGGVLPAKVSSIPIVHFEDIPFHDLMLTVSGMLGYPDIDEVPRVHINWRQIGVAAANMMVQILSDPHFVQPQTLRIEPVLMNL